MRRALTVALLMLSWAALAQDKKKEAKEADLGKKETSVAPDKGLAGDVTRKKVNKDELAPSLKYDVFRMTVESQVAGKRQEQITDLTKIISLTTDEKERPKLLFRLGELFWEESKYKFFQANRKDDDYIQAMNKQDKAGMDQAKKEKEAFTAESKENAKLAVDQYSEIVQKYKDFPRNDEVLYFLGQNLMEMGDERRSLISYKRLIEKYPKSRYLPDAHLAFGEYYFNNSKGKRDFLDKALDAYTKAAAYPENAVYGFAIYKQGWCYFNMADYEKAMDRFKSVVLLEDLLGKEETEGGKGKGGTTARAGLIKEARTDFVRAYSRLPSGTPTEAKDRFARLTKKPDDLRLMMKQLSALYYEDGKDKEAAVGYNMLIVERPTSPEAPGFQSKIVDCVLRAGNKAMTVQQVRRLVKIMDDVKGAVKDEKDKKAIEEARELSERILSNLAVNWHNEAKKTRDDETFKFADMVYADYLTLFPENPKAYDLRFFWAELLNDNLNNYPKAAEEYTKVLMQDVKRIEGGDKGEDGKKKPGKPGKFMVNAAYNAILAYDEVVKKATTEGKIKTETTTDPEKKLTIHPEKLALLEACERYLKYMPNGEKKVEIAYKVAKIYYDYNHLDESTARFKDLALKHKAYKFENGDKVCTLAGNLALDAHNLRRDFAGIVAWGGKLLEDGACDDPTFKKDLEVLIPKTIFKRINQLEANKDYCQAADEYMNFVEKYHDHELADKALYNGAIDFFNCRKLDKAIETRKKLVTSYKKSQHVPATLFALAEGYEAIADFDNASDYYEAYASAFEKSVGGAKPKKAAPKAVKKGDKDKAPPKNEGDQVWEEAKAQIALFNAGVFREGLSQFKVALKNREKYLQLWPDSPDAEAVQLSIVDLLEKSQAFGKAAKNLEEYQKDKKVSRSPSKVLTAEGRIATLFEEKMKNKGAARKVFERILKYHDNLPKRARGDLEITALDAVARAHFVTSEDQYKKYSGIKIKWTKLTNIGEFKASVKEKAKALEGIQKLYTVTVGFKSADPAICALDKIGKAYDHFSEALLNVKPPKGMPEDLMIEFRSQLDNEVLPIKTKAAEAFMAAVAKSQELDVYNHCTTEALTALRTKYRPEQFPARAEDVMEFKSDGKAAPAIGGDVLLSIQGIPVAPTAKPKDAPPGGKGGEGKSVAEIDLSAPPTKASPSPVPGAGSSGKGGEKKKKGDGEPEDEPL
jgi:tetratricopeptide (TPR) repeat protein